MKIKIRYTGSKLDEHLGMKVDFDKLTNITPSAE